MKNQNDVKKQILADFDIWTGRIDEVTQLLSQLQRNEAKEPFKTILLTLVTENDAVINSLSDENLESEETLQNAKNKLKESNVILDIILDYLSVLIALEKLNISKNDLAETNVFQIAAVLDKLINEYRRSEQSLINIRKDFAENQKFSQKFSQTGFEHGIESNEQPLTILHLSDLHLTQETNETQNELNAVDLTSALVNFLEKYQENKRIDVVIVTGDLVKKHNKAGYELFKTMITEICKCLSLNIKEDVILCVGNHEKEKTNTNCNELSLDDVTGARLEEFRGFIDMSKELSIHSLTSRFQTTVSSKTTGDFEYLFGQRKLKGHKNVIFTVYNSAWNTDIELSDENLGKLKIGKGIVDAILPHTTQEDEGIINISLFHHPLTWLSMDEQREYTSGVGKCTSERIKANADIIFNGHVHGAIKPPDVLANKNLNFFGGTLSVENIKEFEIITIDKQMYSCTQEVIYYDGCACKKKADTPDQSPFFFGKSRIIRDALAQYLLGQVSLEYLRKVSTDLNETFHETVKNVAYLSAFEKIIETFEVLHKKNTFGTEATNERAAKENDVKSKDEKK